MDWTIPDVIVLAPGGAKGFLELGSLFFLEQDDILKQVPMLCGISVGAIIAMLYFTGYSINQIIAEAALFNLFKGITIPTIAQIIQGGGLISNESVKQTLIKLVSAKMGNVPSYLELFKRTGKVLITVSFNATNETTSYLTPWTDPEMSIVEGTLCSMNIPILYQQMLYKGKIMVDGALGNPYPVDFFDDGKTKILGIYIKTVDEINTDEEMKKMGFGTYIHKLIQSTITQNRNHIMRHCSKMCRHIELCTMSTDTTGMSQTTDDKVKMIIDGYNITAKVYKDIQENCYKDPVFEVVQKYANIRPKT